MNKFISLLGAGVLALTAMAQVSAAQAHVDIGINLGVPVAPPARVVYVPPQRPGFVWIEAGWEGYGRDRYWRDGYWRPVQGYRVIEYREEPRWHDHWDHHHWHDRDWDHGWGHDGDRHGWDRH
ncbi:hypothetical protein SAMN02745857_03236 [Andreprevotia lacus DSM 23236]|jgi:hypothetical protein|uniref:YXWGXW repeat-containing protein n=1 Tax=Andreprevotia lacus DSM 23236 TaxID=1121001 RepID=A0A1W1XXX0_9NEIS|nr:hypothetical protein [Andreprevotia lacus]SMC28391.1 hypothetical protein SAMN02745857_03236 [Andreprevotia lacus DSM 23236]